MSEVKHFVMYNGQNGFGFGGTGPVTLPTIVDDQTAYQRQTVTIFGSNQACLNPHWVNTLTMVVCRKEAQAEFPTRDWAALSASSMAKPSGPTSRSAMCPGPACNSAA
jgi:hypothetical protein